MPALLPIRFRTELARSFHRDIVNTLNVPSGELNTLNTLDTTMYTYSATAGDTTFSGEDVKGKTLAYTPGRVEVYIDGDKILTDDYIATNGTSIEFLTPIGEEVTTLTIRGIEFADTAINTSQDTITYVDHGFNEGDQVLYFENGATTGITNMVNAVSYYVIFIDEDTIKLATSRAYAIASSPTAINLDGSPSGSAFQLVLMEEYIDGAAVDTQLVNLHGITVPTTGVDTGTETITSLNHGLSNGEIVTYYSNGGTTLGGLTNNSEYYVVNATTDTFKLSLTSGGSAINFTGTGNSNQAFLRIDNTFYLASHGFVTGQEVIFTEDGGSISTLTDATNYFIIKVTNNTIKLATTLANAQAGTAINIKPSFDIGDMILTGPLDQTVTINTFTLTNYPNPHDYFYVFLSRPTEWANEPTPPTPVDARSDDSSIKRNILGVKKVNPSDVTLLARRIDWTTATVYDQYDDTIDMSDLDFYVFNSDNFRVYKCLSNNNGNPSTVKPSFSEVGPKTLSDGYIWQLLYEVPAADRVKFLTADYVPVKFYGTSTRFDHNGTISEIILEDQGSGYTTTPSVIIVGDGVGAEASAVVGSGLVTELNLTNGGSGYSFAFVLILGGGGTGASGSVTIETTDLPNIINQNVAGYAVATNGQIDFIEIVDGGTGYVNATTTVNINGDGEGAAAELTVVDGEITAVTITDRGTGYTFADLTINGDGTNGELRAVISPQGGHGSNIPQELFATTLGIAVNIEDFQEDFFLENDFRQYGIIKNIKTFDNETLFSANTGNGCFVLTVPDASQYNLDDIVTTDSNGKYLVAYVNESDSVIYLLPVINNITEESVLENTSTGTSGLTITSLTQPEISQRTGEVIYYNNIAPLVRQLEQTETFKLYINF
jgi:hypothetical protein